jgi:hypothetical protein
MAAMQNPRVDLVRYTAQDMARAERRMHQLRAVRRGGSVPEVEETRSRERSRLPRPVLVPKQARVSPA